MKFSELQRAQRTAGLSVTLADERIAQLEEERDALRAELDALRNQEPVQIEAVATVSFGEDGNTLYWLIEGGISDLPEDAVLYFSAKTLTGDDGSGEVFTRPIIPGP